MTMMTAVLLGRTGTGLMTRTEIGVAEARVLVSASLATTHVGSPLRTGLETEICLAAFRTTLILETYLFANIALLPYYYFCLTAFCTCANRGA
jgi:hypothetical protein